MATSCFGWRSAQGYVCSSSNSRSRDSCGVCRCSTTDCGDSNGAHADGAPHWPHVANTTTLQLLVLQQVMNTDVRYARGNGTCCEDFSVNHPHCSGVSTMEKKKKPFVKPELREEASLTDGTLQCVSDCGITS